MDARIHLRTWVAPAYALLGLALTVLYFLVPASADAQHVVYQSLGVLGICGLSVGIWRHRPVGPAWPLLLLGLVLWVSGDGYWNAYRLMTGQEAPFPSPADGLYLVAYVPLLAGIAIMVRGGRPRAADILDALIIGLAVSLIVWFAAIHPTAQAHRPSLASAVIADAYPTMDYMLLLALVQLLVTRRRSAALIWVTSAFATVLVTDVVYAWLRSSSAFTTASLVNAGYFAFYLLLGAASLTPTMRELSDRKTAAVAATTESGRLGLLRLGLLAMALLASPAALVLQGTAGDLASILVTAGVGAVVSILVLVRLSMLFVEREHIDARRQRAEAALHELAYRDSLTGLPNRPAIIRAIDELIAAPRSGMFAVIFIDLDRFKSINDRYGHAVGDDVLRATATRLTGAVRSEDTVARHGGDEFIVLLRNLPADDPAAVVTSAIHRIRTAVGAPQEIHASTLADPRSATVDASIGVAVHPTHGATTSELIHRADKQMYTEKRAARGDTEAA
jgi:diguanylate cyclase (GGDEF)-like protein